jgi:hypothetical protein
MGGWNLRSRGGTFARQALPRNTRKRPQIATGLAMLIRASEASNNLIRAEQLTEEEVEELRCDPTPEFRDEAGRRNGADVAIGSSASRKDRELESAITTEKLSPRNHAQ